MKEETKMKVLLAVTLIANLLILENYEAINLVICVILLIATMLMSLHLIINLYGGEGE